jgi:hypothetical protein
MALSLGNTVSITYHEVQQGWAVKDEWLIGGGAFGAWLNSIARSLDGYLTLENIVLVVGFLPGGEVVDVIYTICKVVNGEITPLEGRGVHPLKARALLGTLAR